MIQKISKIIRKYGEDRREKAEKKERKSLEKKVEQGTDFAIREYRDVFEKLAEYDRT